RARGGGWWGGGRLRPFLRPRNSGAASDGSPLGDLDASIEATVAGCLRGKRLRRERPDDVSRRGSKGCIDGNGEACSAGKSASWFVWNDCAVSRHCDGAAH